MNKKGQALVTFILILPILLMIIAYCTDTALMTYEKNRLDGINKMVIRYSFNNYETSNNKILEYIKKNDNKIEILKLDRNEEKTKIILKKNVKSVFGKIIGLTDYEVKSSYIGIIKDKKIKKIKE